MDSLKIIDKVTVTLNEKRDVYEALMSNLGTKGVEIPTATVKKYEKLLAGGIWWIITMHYFYEEGQKGSPFVIEDLKPIQMPEHGYEGVVRGAAAFHRRAMDRRAAALGAAMSRRNSRSASSGTCSAAWFRWSRTTTTSASSGRGAPARATCTRRSAPTAS